MKGTRYDFDYHCFFEDEDFGIVQLLLGVEDTADVQHPKTKRQKNQENNEQIASWGGVLL